MELGIFFCVENVFLYSRRRAGGFIRARHTPEKQLGTRVWPAVFYSVSIYIRRAGEESKRGGGGSEVLIEWQQKKKKREKKKKNF